MRTEAPLAPLPDAFKKVNDAANFLKRFLKEIGSERNEGTLVGDDSEPCPKRKEIKKEKGVISRRDRMQGTAGPAFFIYVRTLMTKAVTAALGAAFFVVSLMVGGGPADAGPLGHAGCVSPERQIEAIERAHPGAVAHAMSDTEFLNFFDATGLGLGDVAVWFERPGAMTAYVVVFADRCRVGGGEIARWRLTTVLGGGGGDVIGAWGIWVLTRHAFWRIS